MWVHLFVCVCRFDGETLLLLLTYTHMHTHTHTQTHDMLWRRCLRRYLRTYNCSHGETMKRWNFAGHSVPYTSDNPYRSHTHVKYFIRTRNTGHQTAYKHKIVLKCPVQFHNLNFQEFKWKQKQIDIFPPWKDSINVYGFLFRLNYKWFFPFENLIKYRQFIFNDIDWNYKYKLFTHTQGKVKRCKKKSKQQQRCGEFVMIWKRIE